MKRLGPLAASTARGGVRGGIGDFGGFFALDTGRYPHPVLVAGTDGVGTKLAVAQAAGRYDAVGLDLVAMCVDDVVCSGAEPLFLLDYLVAGRLDPAIVEAVVAGVAEGCRRAGCALLGGETAEHPGVMAPDDLDVAGFALGVVEDGEELGPRRVRDGDVLVGLPSPGLRANGYSLARHVLFDVAGRALSEPAWAGAEHSLADELLRPSVIYAPAVRGALESVPEAVHACAHITGGGLSANLVRVLPDGRAAHVTRAAWTVPDVFGEIARMGDVQAPEMEAVFNLGLGMVLVVDPGAADAVREELDRGLRDEPGAGDQLRSAVVGEIRRGEKEVVFH